MNRIRLILSHSELEKEAQSFHENGKELLNVGDSHSAATSFSFAYVFYREAGNITKMNDCYNKIQICDFDSDSIEQLIDKSEKSISWSYSISSMACHFSLKKAAN